MLFLLHLSLLIYAIIAAAAAAPPRARCTHSGAPPYVYVCMYVCITSKQILPERARALRLEARFADLFS